MGGSDEAGDSIGNRAEPSVTITLDRAFANLADVGKSLTEETNDLQTAIAAVDEKLTALNLGLFCWITVDKAAGIHIGYGQHQKQWGLLARHGDDTWRLPSAPRYIRIKAVPMFPELLEHMTRAAIAMTGRTQLSVKMAREFLAAIEQETP